MRCRRREDETRSELEVLTSVISKEKGGDLLTLSRFAIDVYHVIHDEGVYTSRLLDDALVLLHILSSIGHEKKRCIMNDLDVIRRIGKDGLSVTDDALDADIASEDGSGFERLAARIIAFNLVITLSDGDTVIQTEQEEDREAWLLLREEHAEIRIE